MLSATGLGGFLEQSTQGTSNRARSEWVTVLSVSPAVGVSFAFVCPAQCGGTVGTCSLGPLGAPRLASCCPAVCPGGCWARLLACPGVTWVVASEGSLAWPWWLMLDGPSALAVWGEGLAWWSSLGPVHTSPFLRVLQDVCSVSFPLFSGHSCPSQCWAPQPCPGRILSPQEGPGGAGSCPCLSPEHRAPAGLL